MATVGIMIWPEQGHLNGSAKLARTIIARGNDVYFISLADFEQPIRDQGFEFVPLLEDTIPDGQMSQAKSAQANIHKSQRFPRLNAIKAPMRIWNRLKSALTKLSDGKTEIPTAGRMPDLLVVDSMLPFFGLIAKSRGIQVLLLSTHLPAEEDPLSPPPNSGLIPRNTRSSMFKVSLAWHYFLLRRVSIRKLLSPFGMTFNMHRVTKDYAAAIGFPAERVNTRTLFAPTLKMPELVTCPREFDFPKSAQRDLSLRTYGDASIDLDRTETELPELNRFDEEKPLIYCSMGSQYHRRIKPFLEKVLSMMAENPQWQMLVAIGSRLKPEDFEAVPSNVVLTQFAPQLAVLRRATIMITHGGLNTVKECIYFGIPMIVFPLWRDHPGNAARVVYHGLGVRSSLKRASAEQLCELITTITKDPEYRRRCAIMRTKFLEAEGKQAGIGLIEDLLGSLPHS